MDKDDTFQMSSSWDFLSPDYFTWNQYMMVSKTAIVCVSPESLLSLQITFSDCFLFKHAVIAQPKQDLWHSFFQSQN